MHCLQTTFVFVTPRRFPGKQDWIADKRSRNTWADVVVWDGDDLVHWLESCPAVAHWLAVRIKSRPEGLRNLEDAWSEWISATDTPLSAEVMLASRDADQVAVLQWLREPPTTLTVSAEAPDEAIAFLHAAISPLPERYSKPYLSRCMIADTGDAARQIIGLGTPLIVVATDLDGGIARMLVEDGHHVFNACGSTSGVVGAARHLSRPWRSDLTAALVDAGVEELEAHRLAGASGRSLTVLRRLMPAVPGRGSDWADQAGPELVAAMFAGGWLETSGPDREMLGRLAGLPYEEVEQHLARYVGPGRPLVKLGTVWKVSSLRDLWMQIGGQVTGVQLERFGQVFQAVLGTVNPRYETRPASRFYERDGEFAEAPSATLRRGMAEAMIALAVFPDRATLLTAVDGWVDRAIATLLYDAGPALWWSLFRDFQNIAEASPESFLNALEEGTSSAANPLTALFRTDEGAMHPTEYLADLLWALEMLARSPDHLTRAASILVRLVQMDLGGKRGNSPFASLERIFVTWSPQTYATSGERLRVIDRIVREYPSVGWNLLVSHAPRSYAVSSPSSMPSWRDFSQDRSESLTWSSVAASSSAIGSRLLEVVGQDAARWQALLEVWPGFPPEWCTQAAERLLAYAGTLESPAEIEALRDELRKLLNRHRKFADSDWAMPEGSLRQLDTVVASLRQSGVGDQVRWLFRNGVSAPGVWANWHEEQSQLAILRTEAARTLLASLGFDEIIAFIGTVEAPDDLGVAVARASALEDIKEHLLHHSLCADDHKLGAFASGLHGGYREAAEADADLFTRRLWQTAIDECWGELSELRIVSYLPVTQFTFSAVAARSEPFSLAYWGQVRVFRIGSDLDPAWIVEQLTEAGRPRCAVDWLGSNIERNPDSGTIIRALTACAASEQVADGNATVMLGQWLHILFGYLDSQPDVQERDMVRLEWTYFQALRHSRRSARNLHRALARDPGFFVQLMSLVWRPADGSGVVEAEATNAAQAQSLALQAYDVLRDWKRVPGSDDDGRIDRIALEVWLKDARKLLAVAGRSEIGDSKIGEILSAAERGGDKPWPPEPICEAIQATGSRVLEKGFEVGVRNRRGVTMRMPHDGGAQERVLAERFRQDAKAIRFEWPRASACLDRIARSYASDADRHDLSAEQRDWLL